MAKKPTITTLQSGFNSTETLNSNFEGLRDAFDNTLSLDGSTPNAMEADLDLNGNNIIGATGLLINGTDYLADVEAAKAAALVAQAAAELAETNAETAEVNAEISETAAGLSATAAATSATAAQTAQTAAELAETNAETAETGAAASAVTAASEAATATTKASEASASAAAAAASETAVDADRVAAQAAASAAASSETNAATSATNAAASETNAANSATSASDSASSASSSAANAGSSATSAATSETQAAASAVTAASEAAEATTQASNAAASETNADNSATSATGSASTATTQASAASASATNAATSASNAATSETNAAASQAAAAISETNAAASESTVETSATNAATSEANAATSASTATTQATNAATSASAASTSASNAATSETNAASSASSAASSASSAQASKDAALAALDSFDDRYLGQKASDPALDNDGDALVAGALYFNTTDDVMKVYEGSVWVAAYASLSGALLQANNLSDVLDVAASRTNLGLGTAAITASTDYATAAQGALADSAVQPNDSPSFGSVTVSGTVDGRDIAADGSKLDGIEAGATADQTASEILTSIKTVDGAGSGLDADLLDGIHASSFLQGNQTITLSGDVSGSGTTSISVTVADDSHNHIIANVDGLQTALDGKLSTTGKAADSNLLDGLDSTAFYLASNPNGYTTNVGDITGVTAGTGLTGGGTSGTVTVSHADTSSQGSVNNSGLTFIQDVSLDAYGHVTSLSSATIAATTGAEKAYFVVYSNGGVIYSSVGFSSVTISSNDATHNFTTAMASSTSYSIAANNNSTSSGIAEIFSETATSFRIAWENRGSGTALGSRNRVTVLS